MKTFSLYSLVSLCPYTNPSPSISVQRKYDHEFSDYYFLPCLHSFARCMVKYTFILACFEHHIDALVPYIFPSVMGHSLTVTLGKQVYIKFIDQPWVPCYISYLGQYFFSCPRSVESKAQFIFLCLILSRWKWSNCLPVSDFLL